MDPMNPINRIPGQQPVRKPKSRPMDRTVLGMIAGLVFGLIGLVVVFFLLYRGKGLDFYVGMFTKMEPTPAYAAKNISLAMICNLVPFYFFLNRKAYQSTKGVIMATGLMGVLFILYKFVW